MVNFLKVECFHTGRDFSVVIWVFRWQLVLVRAGYPRCTEENVSWLSPAGWNSSAVGKTLGKWNQPSVFGCFWISKRWQSKNATASSSFDFTGTNPTVCEFVPFTTKAGVCDSVPQSGFMVLIKLLRGIAASSSWNTACLACSLTRLFL